MDNKKTTISFKMLWKRVFRGMLAGIFLLGMLAWGNRSISVPVAMAAQTGSEGGSTPEGEREEGMPPEDGAGELPSGNSADSVERPAEDAGFKDMDDGAASSEDRGQLPDSRTQEEGAQPEGETFWQVELRVLMRARVRSAPGTEAEAVGSLERDIRVQAVGRLWDENGELWYHIVQEEPLPEGYVKGDLVEEIGDVITDSAQGGQDAERSPVFKAKSNYSLEGEDHLSGEVQAALQAMAATDEKEEAVQQETKNRIAAIYRWVDKKLVVWLVVTATVAAIMLCARSHFLEELKGEGHSLRKHDRKGSRTRKMKKKKSVKQPYSVRTMERRM